MKRALKEGHLIKRFQSLYKTNVQNNKHYVYKQCRLSIKIFKKGSTDFFLNPIPAGGGGGQFDPPPCSFYT